MKDQREPDLYDVLGVPSTVSDTELDHAFRLLARRLHPDLHQDGADDGAFQQVLAAYGVLRDPAARSEYDRRRTPPTPPVSHPKKSSPSRRTPTWSPDDVILTGRTGEPVLRISPVYQRPPDSRTL